MASEYYTSEEMVQFKKVRKKKKLRKVEKVKADDLLPLGPEDTSRDHGARDRGSRRSGFSMCVLMIMCITCIMYSCGMYRTLDCLAGYF